MITAAPCQYSPATPPGSEHLPVQIAAAGIQHLQPGDHYDFSGQQRGSRAHALFQYTIAGTGCLELDGTTTSLTAGTAMLLHWPHNHRYYLPHQSRWHLLYIVLTGQAIMPLWRACCQQHAVITLGKRHPVMAAANNVLTHLAAGESTFSTSAYGYRLVTEILDYVQDLRTAGLPSSIHHAMRAARKALKTGHAGEWDTTRMAATAGLSRAHFSRLFTASLATTPGRWWQSQRLEFARDRILADDGDLSSIAHQAGFGSASALIRAFTAAYGDTPRAYRRYGRFAGGAHVQAGGGAHPQSE